MVLAKTAATAVSRALTPLVRAKDLLLPPRMRWKSSEVGGGGRNRIVIEADLLCVNFQYLNCENENLHSWTSVDDF